MIREITCRPLGYFWSTVFLENRALVASSFGVSSNNSVQSPCKMQSGSCPRLSVHKNSFSGWRLRLRRSRANQHYGKHKHYSLLMELVFVNNLLMRWIASMTKSLQLSKAKTEISPCCQNVFKTFRPKTTSLRRLGKRLVKSCFQPEGSNKL